MVEKYQDKNLKEPCRSPKLAARESSSHGEEANENEETVLGGSSANIFEPEVDIQSEEENLRCTLEDDLSESESDQSDEAKLPKANRNFHLEEEYEHSEDERPRKDHRKNDGREVSARYKTHMCMHIHTYPHFILKNPKHFF